MRRRSLTRAGTLVGLSILAAPLLAGCNAADPLGADLIAQPVHIIFFEGDSVAIGESAMAVVRDAAAIARRYPTQPVRVLGFAGPAGSVAYNRALSNARAQAIAEELREAGVAPARLMVSARGPVEFADIATESRRVEIRIGPQ
jgi:outer membrane protein OmpA-like peptidoglycan-associated protein